MNGQQKDQKTQMEVSKSQNVRLADIFLYGPFLIWAATRKELPTWARWFMGSIGVGTIYYNATNYLSTQQSNEDFPVGEVSQTFLQNWLDLLCEKNPRITELYAKNAVLLPTFSDKVKRGRDQIATYFHQFMQKEDLCGKIDSQVSHRTGDAITTSGIYTFSFKEKGQPKTQKARYTFVFRPDNGKLAYQKPPFVRAPYLTIIQKEEKGAIFSPSIGMDYLDLLHYTASERPCYKSLPFVTRGSSTIPAT